MGMVIPAGARSLPSQRTLAVVLVPALEDGLTLVPSSPVLRRDQAFPSSPCATDVTSGRCRQDLGGWCDARRVFPTGR